MTDNNNVLVNERKFNGVATLEIDAPNKDYARSAARHFWRETYGGSPSNIVVEEESASHFYDYTVMVADHSSGSLKESMTFDLNHGSEE